MIKLITWNINGFNSALNSGNIDKLMEYNPDFICLQEMKLSSEETILEFCNKYQYQYVCVLAQKKGYSGVAVISRNKAISYTTDIGFDTFNSEGRFISLDFEDFILLNVYMIHGRRDKSKLSLKMEACKQIIDYLNENKSKKIIVATDFNIAHKNIDVFRYKNNKNNVMFTEDERNIVQSILDMGYRDAYRLINDDKIEYTWWPYAFKAREKNIGWRIDYFFVSCNMAKYVKNVQCMNDIYGSDHCPIMMEVVYEE